MLSCGYLCGLVFYLLLLQVPKSFLGRVIGIATAGLVCLHFLLQLLESMLSLCLPAALLLGLLFWLLKQLRPIAPTDIPYAPAENLRTASYSYARWLILILLLLSLMHGINEGILLSLYAVQSIDLYHIPRLFYAPGILLAGFLADYQDRRYLPIAVILTMTARIFCLLLFDNPATYAFSLCLAYFCGSFFLIFALLSFLDIAPRMKSPALWASMGRIIELPAASLGAIAGVLLWSSVSLSAIIGIYTAILLVLMLLFHTRTLHYDTQILQALPAIKSPLAKAAAATLSASCNKAALSDQAATATDAASEAVRSAASSASATRLAYYVQRYTLTNRETDVLKRILDGLSIKEIAEALVISERTVKYHISNLLRKTETHSQKELMARLMHPKNNI